MSRKGRCDNPNVHREVGRFVKMSQEVRWNIFDDICHRRGLDAQYSDGFGTTIPRKTFVCGLRVPFSVEHFST